MRIGSKIVGREGVITGQVLCGYVGYVGDLPGRVIVYYYYYY